MMKDQELKRNGSGYVDEPCYKAVTAPPRPGEIFIHGKSGAYMLVLANVNGICPTLRLEDTAEEGDLPVTCRKKMYVKPHRIGYCFDNLLTEFVKIVKGEEMKAVRMAITKALELTETHAIDVALIEEKKALECAVKDLKEENRIIREKNSVLQVMLEEANGPKNETEIMEAMQKDFNDTYARLNQEIVTLTIYKDMYMDIIGKLVALRGGAVSE